MKTRKIFFVLILYAGLLSCTKDTEIVDPIYEFVSFKGIQSVNLNEANNSTEGFPLVVQLYAFNPYTEDIDLTLEVIGTNAQPGVDFTVTPSGTVKIPAGKLTSDTVWIKTIDNLESTDLVRKIEVKLKSASISDLKIGLGLNEHRNASVVLTILDDECSLTTDIYNSSDLTNTIDWGGGDIPKPAIGEIADDQFTVEGNLIDYADYTLVMTLTPNGPGQTKGTATFGSYYAGFASDGYEYKFEQIGTGVYDVCSGTIDVEYDIWYMDGGSWVWWYAVANTYSVPVE